jgi:hypothetical protein
VGDDLNIRGTNSVLSLWKANASSTIRTAGEAADDYRGAYFEYGGVPNVAIIGTHNAADSDTNSDIPQISFERSGDIRFLQNILSPLTVTSTASSTFVNLQIGNGSDYLQMTANNGGAEIDTRDNTRIRINDQVRFDSSNFDINTPPLVFRVESEDDSAGAKGAIIEWQQHFTAGDKDYGSTTKAFYDWKKNGESGAYPTFNVGSTGAKRVGWITAHYDSPSSTGEDIHQHLNIESSKADLSTLITRLSVSYGEDIALIDFPNSELQVHDDRPLYLSHTTNALLKYDSASSTILIDGAPVTVGAYGGDEKLTLGCQNNSATACTIQLAENLAGGNGFSFVLDSANNYLNITDDAADQTRWRFYRDSGNFQLLSGVLSIGGSASSTFNGGIRLTGGIESSEYVERVAEFNRRSSRSPSLLVPCPFSIISVPSSFPISISYLVNSTKSRMNLFRLNDRIDLGPAISSVCQRRSFGLLNWYRLLFNVPITPSVCPRSLRI